MAKGVSKQTVEEETRGSDLGQKLVKEEAEEAYYTESDSVRKKREKVGREGKKNVLNWMEEKVKP